MVLWHSPCSQRSPIPTCHPYNDPGVIHDLDCMSYRSGTFTRPLRNKLKLKQTLLSCYSNFPSLISSSQASPPSSQHLSTIGRPILTQNPKILISKNADLICKSSKTPVHFPAISDPKTDSLNSVLVKICGVRRPEDALFAAKSGADFVGFILWPNSKRSVSPSLGKEIAMAAREGGALPVGVFVDENADEIVSRAEVTGISVAQLHGDNARLAVSHLPSDLEIIYVLHADGNGEIQTAMPPLRRDGERVEWVLVDGMQAGSGEKFKWENLAVPNGVSSRGWLLAGGLNPNNVGEAVGLLRPTAVDVSSGVTKEDKIRKDPQMVASFIHEARGVRC